MADMESTVAGIGMCDTAKPGAYEPYTDTEFCGLPRIGTVSPAVSHGSIFGCSLKSVNQEQAPRLATSEKSATARAARRLAFIADLQRPVLAQHLGRFLRAVGAGD